MKSIPEVSALLAARVKNLRKGKMALCDEAGFTARTLRNVLSGSEDYKVSTLLSLVDRLGMELVYADDGTPMVEPGDFRLSLGGGQPDDPTAATCQVTLQVTTPTP